MFRHWVQRLWQLWFGFRTNARRILQARARLRFRPSLEVLEDRLTPTTFHVTSLLDDGSGGTLREAITQANAAAGADDIVFDTSGTITLMGGQQLVISDSLSITGPAAGLTISGNDGIDSRIFLVDDGSAAMSSVEIVGLTLTGGRTPAGAPNGGAIFNTEDLTLTNCTLFGNQAFDGGGLFNDGTATLTNCTLSFNSASLTGGGLINNGTATLTNCTLSDNEARSGGGLINNGGGTATLTNCTLSGNSALFGVGGGLRNEGTATLTNCTLSGNYGFDGAGLRNTSGTATLNNTIVANSIQGGDIFISGGSVTGSHNLIADGSGGVGLTNGVSGDPNLGDLQNNGGPTFTHALGANSPALNTGSNALAVGPDGQALTSDQRGAPFARRFGSSVDIGAYEAQTLSLVVTTANDELDATYDANDLSLREAVALANATPGSDAITFAASLTGPLTLTMGDLDITDSVSITGPAAGLTISGNNASRIFLVDDGSSFTTSSVEIVGLTLTAGRADFGGAIFNRENLTLTNCTLSDNTAVAGLNNGGGGGGLYNDRTARLTNCTLSGNSARFGGGLANDRTAILTNCTLSGNSASEFGGGLANGGVATLNNTIVANSSGGDIENQGTLAGRRNLIEDGSGNGLQSGVSGDPLLGPLQDNGGPTFTHALLDGSPALNAGDNDRALGPDGVTPLTTDQRGSGFPRIQSVTVDIGAFEAQPPTLDNPIADQNATEDSAFSFPVPANTFSDVDVGDSLSYSAMLSSGAALPGWLNFNAGTQTFSGTPRNADVGTISVQVTVTDQSGQTANDTFDITVANTNDAPTLDQPIADQNATEDSAFSFQVPADTFSDVDVGDSLSYSATLSSGAALPSWLSFNASSRTFSGTPSHADVGTLSVEVTATDEADATASDTFDITVANTNDAPTLDQPIADQNASEDSAFSFQVPANTFNDVDVGDSLSYSATLSSGAALPAWLSFNASNRTFSGTPRNADVGTVSVRVTVTDQSGQTASDTFDITVANTNDAPTLDQPIADQNASEDSAFSFQVPANTFSDVDVDDSLSYSATLSSGAALPSWLSFNADTRTFSGTPRHADVGTLSVQVTATDEADATASDTFDITVAIDAPGLSSFTRQAPATSPTNADTLVFRATFDEAVQNVDTADFAVNGTTTATVSNVVTADAGAGLLWNVTVSGGNLAGFNGVVGLNLNGAQNITDLAGNALPAGEPATDQTYTVVNPDRFIATGPDAGAPPRVRLFDPVAKVEIFSFLAYDAAFTGGVRVALGDLNGDRVPDLIAAPGVNLPGGSRIRVFNGIELLFGTVTEVASFLPFGAADQGGVWVAAADFDGDGFAEVVAGNQPARGPAVKVLDGRDLLDGTVTEQFSVQPFGASYKGGARVAVGDVNADGTPDLIAAQSKNGKKVQVRDGTALGTVLSNFKAIGTARTGGLFVSAGDVNSDGKADILVGLGSGGSPQLRLFDGASLTPTTATRLAKVNVFDATVKSGVRVAALDVDGNGAVELLVTAGKGTERRVRFFDGLPPAVLNEFFAEQSPFDDGFFLAAAAVTP